MNLYHIFELSYVLIYGLSLIHLLAPTVEARSRCKGTMLPQDTTVDFRQMGTSQLKVYPNTCFAFH